MSRQLRGVLHDPFGVEGRGIDDEAMPPLDGWRECPGMPAVKYRAARYDFDILNWVERGECPQVTYCPHCLPEPVLLAHDVILVTPLT
jgi:hypothetical protein